MATPTAQIGLLNCIAGCNCSSISCFVTGNATPNKSLSALAACIGCSAPYKMSCFYNLSCDLVVTPNPVITIPSAGATCTEKVCGFTWDSTVVSTSCSWLSVTTPVLPAASPGANNNVVIASNAGNPARSGSVSYAPQNGYSSNTVTFCQLSGIVWKCVDFCKTASNCGGALACAINCFKYSSALVANECYCACVSAYLSATGQAAGSWACICITCNTTQILCCATVQGCAIPTCAFSVDYNDVVVINLWGCACNTACSGCVCINVCLTSVTCCAGCGYICLGSTCVCVPMITG